MSFTTTSTTAPLINKFNVALKLGVRKLSPLVIQRVCLAVVTKIYDNFGKFDLDYEEKVLDEDTETTHYTQKETIHAYLQ